jgi:hypothetical protein
MQCSLNRDDFSPRDLLVTQCEILVYTNEEAGEQNRASPCSLIYKTALNRDYELYVLG